MGAKNHIEDVLREIHVILSKCEVYDKEKNLVIMDKKRMIAAVQELSQAVYEAMDEYELTQQSRAQGERNAKKYGDELIAEAAKKAEDVYAGSVLYSDEALKRVQFIMQDSMTSVKEIYKKAQLDLENELYQVKTHQTELLGHLQDLSDTKKYLQIIEERNRKLAKEQNEDIEDAEPAYIAPKPEIRINEAYFRAHGLSLEDEEDIPEEKPNKIVPEIRVNEAYFKARKLIQEEKEDVSEEKIDKMVAEISESLDSEYFKWKEQEEAGEKGEDRKKTEKKSLFGKFGK